MPGNHVRARIILIAGTVATVAAIIGVLGMLPPGSWERGINWIPLPAMLAAILLLPLIGFPVTALYLAAGARFGLGWGAALIGVATIFHLLTSYPIAHFARRPVRWLLERAGWKLPRIRPEAAWSFGIWIALLPGVSYTLKNYIGPLSGIGLRVFLGSYLLPHLSGGVVALVLGRATMQFSWTLVAFIVVYAAGLAWLTRRMIVQLRGQQAGSIGPGALAKEAGQPATGS